MKKIITFVSTVNQFLIFLAVLLFIFVAGKDVASAIFKPAYEAPKVKVIDSSGDAKDVAQIKFKTNFKKKILDVYIFDISSDSIKIKPGPNLGDTTINMYSGGSRKMYQEVNLLFVPQSGPGYLLMKNNAYIAKASYYNESSDKHRYNRKLSKNLYLVISKDINSDGFLNREHDVADLYVSDYNGKNMSVVLKGVNDYKLIRDNLVLIEMRAEPGMEFYTYDLLTKKLLKLDTKIPLMN